MLFQSQRRLMMTAAGILLLLAIAPTESFATVTMSLGNPSFSGSNVPGGTLDLAFTETSPGVIELTITNNLTGSGTFLDSLYINLDPSLVATTSVANSGGQTGTANPISTDAYKADGDGKYDVLIEFPQSGDRFVNGETSTWTFTGTGLTENSFNFLSTPAGGHGPFIVAAHVQGFGDSGWITSAPEPATLAMWSLLGMSAGLPSWLRRRRANNAT